jgi:hypothetical protein
LAVVTILVLAAVRSVQGDVRKLLSIRRKGHGEADPCPGTATVLPSPTPPPVETGEPEPAPAQRSTLSAEPARATPALPSAQAEEDDGDRATPDEGTRVWTGKRSKRPTLLGGLAGAPQEPNAPTSSKPDLLATTLVPRGNERPSDDGSIIFEPRREDGSPISDVPGSDKR